MRFKPQQSSKLVIVPSLCGIVLPGGPFVSHARTLTPFAPNCSVTGSSLRLAVSHTQQSFEVSFVVDANPDLHPEASPPHAPTPPPSLSPRSRSSTRRARSLTRRTWMCTWRCVCMYACVHVCVYEGLDVYVEVC